MIAPIAPSFPHLRAAGDRPRTPWRARLKMLLPRRRGPEPLDPERLPDHLLRDLGLADGRGPSLRRPERAERS
jgi:hypothetical protein